MAYVFKRGEMWWAKAKHPITRKWLATTTGIPADPANKRKAKEYARRLQRSMDEQASGVAPSGPLTVRAYGKIWIERRRAADLDWKNDESRLRHHVYDVIGDTLLVDVRPKHVADLARRWRFTTKLAQRTVYNVYSTVSAMFRDAAIDGEIEQTPCILTNAQLGPLVDKDPKWRSQAVYTRDEAEQLISDERIPSDRRLYYACMLLAGMRPGEIAALRWSDYESDAQPLGRLTVALALNTRKMTIKGTKTGAVRDVPVHPTLAAMLAEWRLSGWEAMMGRKPEPGDLVLPLPPADADARRSREGEPIRTGDYAGKKWREVDQPMLGWREREMYAMKSTFITLCGEDGAKRDAIKRITHAKPNRDAFDGYDRASHWPETCREISKLQIARRSRVYSRVYSIV